ncbi:MAG: NAD-dependent epimerase/dehydratase family protein [Candidatus Thorarchaeota archaeon]
MDKIKILLTGASGTVGKDVLAELLKREGEYEISLFLRGSKKNRKNFRNFHNVSIHWGSLHNVDQLGRAVMNQDIVIHLAGLLPDKVLEDPALVKKTNIDGTRNLINTMLKQNPTPKLIYSSSVAVYGDRLKNPIIKISDPIDEYSEDVYAQTKIAGEKMIRDSGLKFVIFRLSYCISTVMLKLRPIMFYMPLETSLEAIHTKDVATALVNAIKTEEVWGRTLNLAGGKKCQIIFRKNLNDLLEIMGFGRKFLPEEAFAKKGFHCGFFDMTEMEENEKLLHFQNHTLEDFSSEVREWIGIRRYLIPLVRPILRWLVLRKSIFYKEFKNKKS